MAKPFSTREISRSQTMTKVNTIRMKLQIILRNFIKSCFWYSYPVSPGNYFRVNYQEFPNFFDLFVGTHRYFSSRVAFVAIQTRTVCFVFVDISPNSRPGGQIFGGILFFKSPPYFVDTSPFIIMCNNEYSLFSSQLRHCSFSNTVLFTQT